MTYGPKTILALTRNQNNLKNLILFACFLIDEVLMLSKQEKNPGVDKK